MDVENEVQHLQRLVKDPQANLSEIVRIYRSMALDGNSAMSSVLSTLNKLAVHLLSPEVTSILLKHRLEAFSYILVANYLLDVDELKDDLENGDVLVTTAPANAIRKLKNELGVAPTLVSAMPAIPTVPAAAPAPVGNLQAPTGITISMDSGGSRAEANSLRVEIKKQCANRKKVNGMTLYKLPLNARENLSGASSIVKRFSFGEPYRLGNKTCKTILLMGATGTGKTTMINAMINYVLGVQWEDPFRFILVDENETCQAFSLTRYVTAYDIHYRNGFLVPYSLTIVDTPGFGDTNGVTRDQEITSAVKQFFEHENGIHELNAVCFVVQSSLARLTSSQTYIFSSVLSIFGKDIGENVRFLITFADGREPLVLAPIKEAKLPCRMDSKGEPCHQSFNNGVIYVSNRTPGDQLSPIEWGNAIENFRLFFDELCQMPVKSLQLTKEVLKIREILHFTIESIQTTIKVQLMKMEELRKIEETIALNKDLVDANKNFEITFKVAKKKLLAVAGNQTALNCSKCEVTCHFPCNPHTWKCLCPAFWRSERLTGNNIDGAGEAAGSVASSPNCGFTCKVCPGKCKTDDHVNETTKWTYVQEDETRTFYDVRKKYDDATERRLDAEGMKNALQNEVEQLKSEIIDEIEKANHCSNLLNEIALQGDSFTTSEYINVMIEKEKKDKKTGYWDRIQSLEDLLTKAKLTKDVTDDGSDLVNQYKKK